MRTQLLTAAFMLALISIASAQTKIPPAAEGAAKALKDSPRHGEYVDVALKDGQAKIKTYVVYPEKKEKAGVVLVIHEIFGLTDWVRAVADQLAADGFIAVAPDMLSGKGPNGGGTDSFKGDEVKNAIRTLSTEEVNARLDAVREYALALPAANGKTASIGFCWGGSASFNYAVHHPTLNAAVVYYGSGPKDKEAFTKIQCPVLGLYGGDDGRVTQTVAATEAAMQEASKPFTKHIYDGAGHGFLRQQTGGKDGANPKAAEQAWKETAEFLKKHLE
jgi:carboxymethylenebutenolidase